MININEALNIELIDEYIDLKNNNLNNIIKNFNDIIKKYKMFTKEYDEAISSLSDYLNKKVESLHNTIESFMTSYESIENKILALENELLTQNDNFKGDITNHVQEELMTYLKQQLDEVKNNVKKILDNYIVEFEKCQKILEKSISKLQKLKEKTVKNIITGD